MARRKDDLYEYNAPKYFVDFTQHDFDEVDDSYFDVPCKTPKSKKQVQESPHVAKTTELVSEATKSPATVAEMEQPQTVPAEQPQTVTPEQPQTVTAEQPQTVTPEQSQTVTAEPHNTQQEQLLTEHVQETECPKGPVEHHTEQPSTEHTETKQATPEHQEDVPGAEHSEKPEQPPTEHSEELDQVVTDHLEESVQPSTEEPNGAPSAQVRSASGGNRRRSLKFNSVGVRQSSRLSAISKALRRSSAARRSVGDSQATTSRTQDNQVKKTQTQKRTMRRVSGVCAITQEDREELAAVTTFRQKITNNKKKNNTSGPSQPLRPTKPQEFHFATDQRLRKHQVEDPASPSPPITCPIRTGPTKPREFNFATDARLKVKEHVKGEEAEDPMDFVKSLRSSTLNLNKDLAAGKGATIPQPFNLSKSRRPQAEEPKKFVAMAELNCKFYVQTPEKFRSCKRASSTEELEDKKKPRATVARTPNLATRQRRRSLSLMTYEEREQCAFEEAQKHAFKARPVNRKVLEMPSTGYQVQKKLSTVPEPFNITDAKKPQTPLLPESLTAEMSDAAKLSESSLPYGGLPLSGKRLTTKIQPFSFDSRDKAKMLKKQERIKKVLEEEKSLAEFHAQPMPIFEDGVHGVPAKKPPTPTQVKPFALKVECRGSLKQEKFKQRLEKEAEDEAAQRKFHAQDDHVVHKNPFIPEKSNKPLTEISNITLNTEVRASDRSEFDHHQKMLEEEMLASKRMEEERRAAEELAEVTRLRQAAVHKAQPVPKVKAMLIQPTQQLPTVPKSPNFATNSRLHTRSQANSTFSL